MRCTLNETKGTKNLHRMDGSKVFPILFSLFPLNKDDFVLDFS